MTQGRASRTWTIDNERVRVDLLADGDLVITTMERGTIQHPGKRFAVYDHIAIPAVFVPHLGKMMASLPPTETAQCRFCSGLAENGICTICERPQEGEGQRALVSAPSNAPSALHPYQFAIAKRGRCHGCRILWAWFGALVWSDCKCPICGEDLREEGKRPPRDRRTCEATDTGLRLCEADR